MTVEMLFSKSMRPELSDLVNGHSAQNDIAHFSAKNLNNTIKRAFLLPFSIIYNHRVFAQNQIVSKMQKQQYDINIQ